LQSYTGHQKQQSLKKTISVEPWCKLSCGHHLPFTTFACEGVDLLSVYLWSLSFSFEEQSSSVGCIHFHLELRKIENMEEV